ncbi:MAG: hypothetical protein WCJ30_14995 [Deltaproteobacteria bacterium]
MINLDRIERRANAATEGPWGFSCGDRRYIADPSTDVVGEVAPEYSGQTICVFSVASANEKDAEFIASARADVPALIVRVRELEAECERDEAKAHMVCLEALLREKTEECGELDEERREAWQHVQNNMSHVFLKGAHGALADAGDVEVPPLTKPIDETIRAIVRERDEMRCRVRELEAERDEARAQLAAADTGAPCDGHRHCCADRRKLAEELLRVRAERDALRDRP